LERPPKLRACGLPGDDQGLSNDFMVNLFAAMTTVAAAVFTFVQACRLRPRQHDELLEAPPKQQQNRKCRGGLHFLPPGSRAIETLPTGGGEHNHDPTTCNIHIPGPGRRCRRQGG